MDADGYAPAGIDLGARLRNPGQLLELPNIKATSTTYK
jgi:hypothetical protein